LDELIQLRRAAKERKEALKPQSKWLRREHLLLQEQKANDSGNVDGAKQIRQKLAREANVSMWRRINWTTQDPHPGALMRVETQKDGITTEFTTEELVVNTIFDETEDRFSLAGLIADISNSSISPDLGYLGFTPLGKSIIEGDFLPPPDISTATAALLSEIGELGKQFADNHINIEISPTEFSSIWSKAKEKTSSSMSGVHFGHYIVAAKSKFMSTVLAKKVSLIARTGSPPQRWRNVLMVMIEKKLGCALVGKLRAILLKEADDNFHSGVIFGGRMMERARSIGLIPEEQMAKKQCTAEDGVFQKIYTTTIPACAASLPIHHFS